MKILGYSWPVIVDRQSSINTIPSRWWNEWIVPPCLFTFFDFIIVIFQVRFINRVLNVFTAFINWWSFVPNIYLQHPNKTMGSIDKVVRFTANDILKLLVISGSFHTNTAWCIELCIHDFIHKMTTHEKQLKSNQYFSMLQLSFELLILQKSLLSFMFVSTVLLHQ